MRGAEAGSEHFLQFGLAVHIGQDRSLLDGVVVLVEGKGAGDALNGAAGNGVDDGLLVLVRASLETLLVLDAITGQNAISQAKEFCKAADATGIILTKLDGTAKGGCVVAVKQRLGLPVRFIGVGEGIDDLIPFTPEGFVEELIPRTGWKH